MKNTFNKVTQSLFEAFKGPRTKDFEFEKMCQEYEVCKGRMLSLKSVIDNYPSRLEGYKLTLDSLISNFETIFSKDQENYFQFMSNVAAAHKALSSKLLNMFNKTEQLKSSMDKWTENCSSVDGKLSLREEKRKIFDHYDEKMAEMIDERNKLIVKGKIPSEKDDEKYFRNIKKYQNAAKEYVDATNDAYKHICYFLDSRYDNISISVVDFIQIEASFYNEASYIFNFFKNYKNNVMGLRQNFRPTHRDYEASNFIRGKSLLNLDIEELMKSCTTISGVIEGKPGARRNSIGNNNEMNKAKTFNQNMNNNINKRRSNTFLNPYGNNNNNNYYRNNNYGNNNYGNNNYGNNNFGNNNFGNNNYGNNSNYVNNPYTNKIDNSIPDPFANEQNTESLNPYGENNNMNNDMPPHNINPYNQGNNNSGDNPFDHPNI